MLHIEWHGFIGALEDGGLVHVVPEALNAHAHKVGVERAPPIAAPCQSEFRKDAISWPHLADVERAILVLHTVVAGRPGIKRLVALVGSISNVKVGDGNDLEALFAQV